MWSPLVNKTFLNINIVRIRYTHISMDLEYDSFLLLRRVVTTIKHHVNTSLSSEF